uniref:Uncharacterized protein n=1 Tax=Manihot esculenta TaxID=3983 RepID=A0A2C9UG31_MANES
MRYWILLLVSDRISFTHCRYSYLTILFEHDMSQFSGPEGCWTSISLEFVIHCNDSDPEEK